MNKFMVAVLALITAAALQARAEDAKKSDKPHPPHKTFEQLDANSDGKISLDEFKAGITLKDPAKAEEIFKKKDANADGSLSKDEMGKHGGPKKDGADKPK